MLCIIVLAIPYCNVLQIARDKVDKPVKPVIPPPTPLKTLFSSDSGCGSERHRNKPLCIVLRYPTQAGRHDAVVLPQISFWLVLCTEPSDVPCTDHGPLPEELMLLAWLMLVHDTILLQRPEIQRLQALKECFSITCTATC